MQRIGRKLTKRIRVLMTPTLQEQGRLKPLAPTALKAEKRLQDKRVRKQLVTKGVPKHRLELEPPNR